MEIFKPCPFCGGRDLRITSRAQPCERTVNALGVDEPLCWYDAYVYCPQCNTRGPLAMGERGQNEVPSRKLAIELWNRRTYDV